MSEQPPKSSKKALRNQERIKSSFSPKDHASSRKHQRKGESPVVISSPAEQAHDFGTSNSWICKNSACKAILSVDDTFCKRCSCCICHLFDDNKDPSLWLVCTSESGNRDSCGLSCHTECALQHGKVGVVDLGQLMQLDGSYRCASCGKVSGILGCWKKQLNAAKDARRVDVLCYRIFLSYRLLDGTSRFKELHKLVDNAKAKLEAEVGPLNGVSARMARGIVSRLPIAAEVQKLCSLAIDKADEWLATVSNTNPNHRECSLPTACRFHFEEVTSSSVVIVLLDLPSVSSNDIKGYKLWYCRSRGETYSKEPICAFPRVLRRVLISNLQPCTEYSFRVISYTDDANLGHSEARCFTKSVEIIHKNPQTRASSNARRDPKTLPAAGSTSGFKVRDLGKILQLAWAQEQGGFEGFSGIDIEECCGASEAANDQLPPISRELDLNVASVPDLNEDLTPPFESSGDDYQAKSHGSGDSLNWTHGANGEVPAIDSSGKPCMLGNGSPCRMTHESRGMDDNFEYCVKTIRRLEYEGRIKREFMLKLLTWFSLRSTEQERRVVNTFIRTMINDPSSLAAQLVDTFSDTISNKKPRNGLCS